MLRLDLKWSEIVFLMIFEMKKAPGADLFRDIVLIRHKTH